jgi:hypothetical protein
MEDTAMTSIAITTQSTQPRAALWTARVLGAIAALFLTFDGVIHVLNPALVVQASVQLGFPVHLMPVVGVIELACLALYLARRTSFIGALLLTAYLGGATAIQVRAESVPFNIVFPAIVATLLWSSLVLRDARIRALLH